MAAEAQTQSGTGVRRFDSSAVLRGERLLEDGQRSGECGGSEATEPACEPLPIDDADLVEVNPAGYFHSHASRSKRVGVG